jgi:hypothetical protein
MWHAHNHSQTVDNSTRSHCHAHVQSQHHTTHVVRMVQNTTPSGNTRNQHNHNSQPMAMRTATTAVMLVSRAVFPLQTSKLHVAFNRA